MAHSSWSDVVQFLRCLAVSPRRVAAVSPSSPALARLITREILPSDGPVLELGAGTGVFTRALLARGVPERELTLVEYGNEFAHVLRRRFTEARVLRMDASHLKRHALYPEGAVGSVISGLPLLSMPPEVVAAILAGAFHYLRPGGGFYQFTYGLRCPVPEETLHRLGLAATRVGGTFYNLPPARVYRLTRRETVPADRRARQNGRRPVAAALPAEL